MRLLLGVSYLLLGMVPFLWKEVILPTKKETGILPSSKDSLSTSVSLVIKDTFTHFNIVGVMISIPGALQSWLPSWHLPPQQVGRPHPGTQTHPLLWRPPLKCTIILHCHFFQQLLTTGHILEVQPMKTLAIIVTRVSFNCKNSVTSLPSQSLIAANNPFFLYFPC